METYGDLTSAYVAYIKELVGSRPVHVFFGDEKRTKTSKAKENLCKDLELGPATLNRVPKKKFLSNIRNKESLISLIEVEFEKNRISTKVTSNSCHFELIKFAEQVGMGAEVPNIFTDEPDVLILLLVHLNAYMILVSNHQGTYREKDIWTTLTAN